MFLNRYIVFFVFLNEKDDDPFQIPPARGKQQNEAIESGVHIIVVQSSRQRGHQQCSAVVGGVLTTLPVANVSKGDDTKGCFESLYHLFSHIFD
jgi:hypothetical protein